MSFLLKAMGYAAPDVSITLIVTDLL